MSRKEKIVLIECLTWLTSAGLLIYALGPALGAGIALMAWYQKPIQ